jgi:hypothetical protein
LKLQSSEIYTPDGNQPTFFGQKLGIKGLNFALAIMPAYSNVKKRKQRLHEL